MVDKTTLNKDKEIKVKRVHIPLKTHTPYSSTMMKTPL